ncbi:MAG: DNA methyltransferase [Promethearchaeota archaeon]
MRHSKDEREKSGTARISRFQAKTAKDLLQLFQNIEKEDPWSFSWCKPSDTSKWTHGYHRYPAKFIPQLVEQLMDIYIKNNNTHVNDPFFGSGTTIVSAISRGFRASGTDINKIAYLITKVKATPIAPDYLEKKINAFLSRIENLKKNQHSLLADDDVSPLIPRTHAERIDYWFSKENQVKIGKILAVIHKERDEKIKDYFLVALSHILKNCSIWSQGSTKPTRDKKKKVVNPYDMIKKQLKKMERGNFHYYNAVPKAAIENIDDLLNIKIGDARHQPVSDNDVDLIVTSSPYVTSYEYADLHQLSTIWLDLARDLKEYRKNFIGTAYKSSEGKKLRSEIATEIVTEMNEKSAKMAREIKTFFIDMEEVFDESFRILKMGGRACFIIGNTRLKGVDIKNAEVFAESMQYSGFTLDKVIKREIPLKILPQKRDEKTGRFASNKNANTEAYPSEFIIIGQKK